MLSSGNHESYFLSLGSHVQLYMYDKAGVRGIHEHIVGGEIGSLEYASPPAPPLPYMPPHLYTLGVFRCLVAKFCSYLSLSMVLLGMLQRC